MKSSRSVKWCTWLLIAGIADNRVASAGSLPPPQNPNRDIWISSGSDCVVEQHSVYYFPESSRGTTRAASAEDCCTACRQYGGSPDPGAPRPPSGCNIWTYCPEERGCAVDDVAHHPLTGEPARVRLSLAFQDCLLQYDKGSVRRLATAPFYQNRNVTRPSVPFVSGALLTFAPEEAPDAGGYQRYPGVEFSQQYDWACPPIPSDLFASWDSDLPHVQQPSSPASGCWVRGPLQALLRLCDAWEGCVAVDYFPGGFSDNPDLPEVYPSGWLKTTGSPGSLPDLSLATMNPNAVTYVKLPRSPGLPAGRKLALALGAGGSALAVLLVGGTFWLLRRRRARRSKAGAEIARDGSPGDLEEGVKEWEGDSPEFLQKKLSGTSSSGAGSEGDTAFEGSPWHSQGTDGVPSPARAYSRAGLPGGGELDPVDIEYVLTKGEPQLLGRGSFGAVYLARWQKHTLVAVKTVLDGNPEEEDLLLKEAEMLQHLCHPNIVQFLGVCRVPGKLMVATEYMARGTLAKAIAVDREAVRRTGWYKRGRQIALDIARGIAFLHDQKIIHMDISSSNVLLDMGWNAKISDVGMSKVVMGDNLQNTMRGTLAYMAIEMYDSEAVITYAVDVFSFGVILNEIVTGEAPSKRRGLSDPKVPDDCPQAVVDLYMCCMAEDPAQRPTSWQLVHTLEKLLPLSPRSPGDQASPQSPSHGIEPQEPNP